jgi:methyl-accepting chemotaxis protein
MERGLGILREAAQRNAQVQLSTQYQRSATSQVMDAIEHIAHGGRSVALATQDRAAAAASQGELTADPVGSGRADDGWEIQA